MNTQTQESKDISPEMKELLLKVSKQSEKRALKQTAIIVASSVISVGIGSLLGYHLAKQRFLYKAVENTFGRQSEEAIQYVMDEAARQVTNQ